MEPLDAFAPDTLVFAPSPTLVSTSKLFKQFIKADLKPHILIPV